jgi:hypothetical protein
MGLRGAEVFPFGGIFPLCRIEQAHIGQSRDFF